LTSFVVDDQDQAIRFFVDVLGFELVEDSPATTNDGRPKRWIVVRPPGAATGLLLAQADGERQAAIVGDQFGGRVGLFLRVDDFDAAFQRMVRAGVEFVGQPRHEVYGSVVVFVDVVGNKWDLLGPRPEDATPDPSALVVRRERPADVPAVRSIQIAAFGNEAGDEPIEAELLDNLRTNGWIPELSLVAELDGALVGHAICSRGHVDGVSCVGLGPIGVAPALQHTGIGSAMMHAMTGAADAMSEPLIALLGNPAYYKRFGFRPSTEFAIEPPKPAWGDFFQVLPLTAWTPEIAGTFEYAAPFNELDE